MNDDREEKTNHPVEDLNIERDCPRPACQTEGIFNFDSDISDYDDIHWLDDSGNPSDYALSPDCFMDILSPLCLENSSNEFNLVQYDTNPVCLESSYDGQPRPPRGTLSDSEFDYSGSSRSHPINRSTFSSRSTHSSNSPIFNFPSIRPRCPTLSAPPRPKTFASTFKTEQCGRNSECLISTKAFSAGYHEWSIKIKECGFGMQEIGIITRCDTDKVLVDADGDVTIGNNLYFGARAVYGCCSRANRPYYASFNQDNSSRCSRQLLCQSVGARHKWVRGDIVTVCVDMDLFKVKFVKNGKAVRKSMSLQRGRSYYPCIAFVGRCRYDVVCVM